MARKPTSIRKTVREQVWTQAVVAALVGGKSTGMAIAAADEALRQFDKLFPEVSP